MSGQPLTASFPPAGGRPPVNILLVDDQPGKLLSYETILAGLGENLIRASSGNEALQHLLRTEIAVVLVDVCMPELDGFELASMIRSHPRFKKTAIILVSGVLVDDHDRLKGYDSGAVDYVSVPIIPEILRAKVAVFAELFRKTQELQYLNEVLEQRVAERTAEIEAAMARLRLVLSTSGARVWTWNIPRDEVTVVSPAGGPEPPHGSFAAFLALVHPDDREGFQRAVQSAVASGRDYEVEFRVMDGGQPRWLLGRGAVLRDAAGAAASLSGIDVDISERKRGEEERLRLLAQAQDASREAATANRLKDEFLATLSHELRTPLNAITGWAHLLSTGTLDEPTRVRAVDTITRNAHLQHQLISDILDVSRIIAGKLRLELGDADLRAIVDSAVDACGPAAAVRDITVSVASSHPTIPVYADAGRLQQVVSNLLSNAVKFGAAGGRVEVALLASEQDVLLVVQDEGPGIRPDFLPFVFDRFRQADSSSTRPHHGLGLGLAIVRHLLEMHGGTVEAVNRTDRPGAVFRVRLPRRIPREAGAVVTEPPRENAPVDAAPKAAPLEGVRVLIVDDEPDGRELAATVLEHAGAETRVAASAAEAIAVLERERIDVLVTDIEMPGEDGYALLRRIRTLDSPAARMPVAALTAYAGAHDRERVLAAGFQVHVAKPVHPEELTAVVAGLVRAAGRE